MKKCLVWKEGYFKRKNYNAKFSLRLNYPGRSYSRQAVPSYGSKRRGAQLQKNVSAFQPLLANLATRRLMYGEGYVRRNEK
jgi:hypothetical protein